MAAQALRSLSFWIAHIWEAAEKLELPKVEVAASFCWNPGLLSTGTGSSPWDNSKRRPAKWIAALRYAAGAG
jgi:hypothetical protein